MEKKEGFSRVYRAHTGLHKLRCGAGREGQRRWQAIAYLHSFSKDDDGGGSISVIACFQQHVCVCVFRDSILNCQLELAGAVAATTAAGSQASPYRVAHIY